MKALLSVLSLLTSAGICIAQTPQTKQPAPFWTVAEEKEYRACLPHSLEVWKNQKAADDYCLTDEEHKRWLRNHPKAKVEDKAKMQACLRDNAAKINGTKEEFRVAFDECEAEAYGIPLK